MEKLDYFCRLNCLKGRKKSPKAKNPGDFFIERHFAGELLGLKQIVIKL